MHTSIAACKIVDGHSSGTPRCCPIPCHDCSDDTGEREYMCSDGRVCDSPAQEPERREDSGRKQYDNSH